MVALNPDTQIQFDSATCSIHFLLARAVEQLNFFQPNSIRIPTNALGKGPAPVLCNHVALQLIDDKVSVMADLGFLMIGKIPRCTIIGSFQVPRHLHQYSHPHPAHAHAFAITSF